MTPWLLYLIAFVVGCHGFIYIPFGFAVPGKMKGWSGRSLLLGNALTGDRLTALTTALNVMAGIATLGCAVAIGLAPLAAGWWRPLAIAGATLGIAAFAVFWDGQTKLLPEEGGIGASISLILLAIALALPAA